MRPWSIDVTRFTPCGDATAALEKKLRKKRSVTFPPIKFHVDKDAAQRRVIVAAYWTEKDGMMKEYVRWLPFDASAQECTTAKSEMCRDLLSGKISTE